MQKVTAAAFKIDAFLMAPATLALSGKQGVSDRTGNFHTHSHLIKDDELG